MVSWRILLGIAWLVAAAVLGLAWVVGRAFGSEGWHVLGLSFGALTFAALLAARPSRLLLMASAIASSAVALLVVVSVLDSRQEPEPANFVFPAYLLVIGLTSVGALVALRRT